MPSRRLSSRFEQVGAEPVGGRTSTVTGLHRIWALTAQGLAAAVLGGAALAVALRFVDFGVPLLFPIVAIAPALLAITAVVLAVIGPGRFVRAMSIAALVVLLFAAPASARRVTCTTPATATPTITVFSHNVHFEGGDPEPVAAQIETVGPDIVFLQEAEPDFIETVQQGLAAPYEHVAIAESRTTLSLAVLSRWELTDVIDTTVDADRGKLNPVLDVSVATPIGSLRMINLHISAPRSDLLIGRWRQEYARLAASEADVLVGDFNSAHAHLRFRELLGLGYRDAHATAGCRLGATWAPSGTGPSLLALDHVLTADGRVRTVGFDKLDRAGSDHQAIIATLAVD